MINSETSDKMVLNLVPVGQNLFRLIIDEPNPSSRFRLDSILIDNLPLGEFTDVQLHTGRVTAHFGNHTAELYANPFKVEFYYQGVLQSVFNVKGLFTFEQEGENKAVAVDITFPEASRTYGIPEHADHLSLRTTKPGGPDPYRLYALDVPGYELNETMALYGAVPILYAHSTKTTTGIFSHNAAETWVEITNGGNDVNTYWMIETGVIDMFILPGPTPQEAVVQYASLTGTVPLPQYFALGYHQSRWNYIDELDVKTVVAKFDQFDFPLDVMWLDIEYTDAKKYFTWNPENFSTPLDLQANLTATNRKLVTILDPHIKVEQGYFVYDEALANDYFVKNPDGSVFEGDCWPGLSSYIDYLNPAASKFYKGLYALDRYVGSTEYTYVWNDMNEPSVFNDTIEKTFPKDLVHYGNVTHLNVHNIYGFGQTKATFEGLLARSENTRRPFVLTRSFFSGSQRYTAIWTGDNTADWGFLAVSIPMCLSAGLSGFSFCGADVGGFFNDPAVDLLQRWYQTAAWIPFYRAHAMMGTARREPYLYPDDVQARIRTALKLRYSHLPVWYTQFWEHSRFGEPVMRPLFYEYPSDSNVLDIDNQFMIGSNILVRPVTEPDVSSVSVYFPGGANELWYDITNNNVRPGVGFAVADVDMDSIPVYYRGGSIIPRKMVERPTTVLMHDDPITLYVMLDNNREATGTFYVDDAESFNYKDNEYTYLRFSYIDDTLYTEKIDLDADYPDANLIIDEVVVFEPAASRNAETQFLGAQYKIRRIKINGPPDMKKPMKML